MESRPNAGANAPLNPEEFVPDPDERAPLAFAPFEKAQPLYPRRIFPRKVQMLEDTDAVVTASILADIELTVDILDELTLYPEGWCGVEASAAINDRATKAGVAPKFGAISSPWRISLLFCSSDYYNTHIQAFPLDYSEPPVNFRLSTSYSRLGVFDGDLIAFSWYRIAGVFRLADKADGSGRYLHYFENIPRGFCVLDESTTPSTFIIANLRGKSSLSRAEAFEWGVNYYEKPAIINTTDLFYCLIDDVIGNEKLRYNHQCFADTHGRVWIATAYGIVVLAPDFTPLHRFALGDNVSHAKFVEAGLLISRKSGETALVTWREPATED